MRRRIWIILLAIGIPVWGWVGSYVYLRVQGTHTIPASTGGVSFGGTPTPPTPAVTSVLLSVPRNWETACRFLYTPLVKLDRALTGTPIMATWNPAFCHGGKGG